MKRLISTVGALTLLTAASAHALPILDLNSALALTDPTQQGRLSRNGIPQDWTGGEAFPGVINPTTTYHYKTYLVNPGSTPFLQIDFDSVSVNTFVSAYDSFYVPNSAGAPNFGFNTNWLGDAGVSGNFFGVDPLFFQVTVPTGHLLEIVINQTAAGTAGIGDPFHLTVEGFLDTEFTDPEPAPEPATMLLTASGLAWLVRRRRR